MTVEIFKDNASNSPILLNILKKQYNQKHRM